MRKALNQVAQVVDPSASFSVTITLEELVSRTT